MEINFTNKELQLIESMVPGNTAEETCNIVLRDWFKSNISRLYQVTAPAEQVLDELIVSTVMQTGVVSKGSVPQDVAVSSSTI